MRDIDDWIGRLEAAGHFVSCSSGTSGKSAMLNASAADMEWSKRDAVCSFSWGSGVTPAKDRKMFGLAPVASVPRNLGIRAALLDAYGLPGSTPFTYPVPPITIGQITGMVALRKSIADGTARPTDLAAYEATSAARQKAVDQAVGLSAEALVQARGDKLFLSGHVGFTLQSCRGRSRAGVWRRGFPPRQHDLRGRRSQRRGVAAQLSRIRL